MPFTGEACIQIVKVFGKISTPLDVVHILQINLGFLISYENRIFTLVKVKTV